MTKYHVGQKINLWQIYTDDQDRTARILKSVLVTVAEVKTGVKEDITGKPSTEESVLAFAEDGTRYERFWDRVPICMSFSFHAQWSVRDDCEPIPGYNHMSRSWTPMEAWCAYNDLLFHCDEEYKLVDQIVGPNGQAIVPEGDVVKCEKHDTYQPKYFECSDCVFGGLE